MTGRHRRAVGLAMVDVARPSWPCSSVARASSPADSRTAGRPRHENHHVLKGAMCPPQNPDRPERLQPRSSASSIPAGDYAGPVLDRLLDQTEEKQRATDLVYGTLRNLNALDAVIAQFSGRPTARIDPALLSILRIGVYELVYSPATPVYSIVNEAVSNVENAGGKKQTGFVNAVLRQIERHITDRQIDLAQANPRRTLVQTPQSGCQFDTDLLPDPATSLQTYLSTCFSLPLVARRRMAGAIRAGPDSADLPRLQPKTEPLRSRQPAANHGKRPAGPVRASRRSRGMGVPRRGIVKTRRSWRWSRAGHDPDRRPPRGDTASRFCRGPVHRPGPVGRPGGANSGPAAGLVHPRSVLGPGHQDDPARRGHAGRGAHPRDGHQSRAIGSRPREHRPAGADERNDHPLRATGTGTSRVLRRDPARRPVLEHGRAGPAGRGALPRSGARPCRRSPRRRRPCWRKRPAW